ncbi:MAG: hypothetical protein JXA20_18230, partial [Spirochaetes bacterium]|nr:hypothetical protein [Spirochaetota bacterium]
IPLEGQGGSRTVLDYYYLLPDYLFYCESPVQATRGLRQRSIVRSNIRNGYMEAKSEGYPMYLALFNNRKTGLEIVAVSISCGQGCMCNRFDLLRRQGDAWREVTASIMPTAQEMNSAVPNRSGGSFSYELPEFGTAIRVLDYDTEEHLMDLQWDGARFVIRRRNL